MNPRSAQTRRPAPDVRRCTGCGSAMVRLVRTEGVHFGRYDCMACGRIGPWIKCPWTLERARAFVLPFGKFKGRTIGELAGDNTGRSYLTWAAENLEGNAGTAAAIALGLKTPEDGGAA